MHAHAVRHVVSAPGSTMASWSRLGKRQTWLCGGSDWVTLCALNAALRKVAYYVPSLTDGYKHGWPSLHQLGIQNVACCSVYGAAIGSLHALASKPASRGSRAKPPVHHSVGFRSRDMRHVWSAEKLDRAWCVRTVAFRSLPFYCRPSTQPPCVVCTKVA